MSLINILIYIAYFGFVIFVVTFFSWSTIILQRQKKSWHTFAKKHNLVYHQGTMMQASAVDGNYRGYRIGLFSEGKIEENRRGFVRFRTVIEVIFGENMPTRGAFGNTDANGVVQYLNYGTTYIMDEKPNWDKNYLITTEDHEFLKEYLTPTRLKGLNSFFKLNKTTTMFVFNERDSFLRLETANPLTEPERVEKLINKIVHLAEALKLSKTERERFMPNKNKSE